MLERNYLRSISILPTIGECTDYFAALPVVQSLCRLDALRFQQPVTFLVGENGTGKSTLVEAIAVAWGFNPEGGTVNFNFASRETHSGLYQHLRLARDRVRPRDGFFLRAESFYNVASQVDQLYQNEPVPDFYGGRSLHDQSHGESFMSLVLSRFGAGGLYLLDEPEAALSPSRQMALLATVNALVQADCQLIIATHSPILMAYPQADIFTLSEDGITKTPYRETEHYTVTKQFLENPDRIMRYLFAPEE